ncbi:MAG: methionyl-tRNA formyltransferase [Candidatus Magasanikbacteria bacterium]|nr:methionyl-tRNA formyltransferase [Candidatus Magasanikbacteria bacterium]
MTSILYFGTSGASATVLEALARTQGFSISGVVTQPDRAVGRGQTVTPSPVKVAAEKLGLPVLCPENLKDFPLETLPSADIFVVYAYGLIIPQVILDCTPHGALNIHPSLLPKYRGPTPIQSTLMNGETETGTSIMLLDAKMDHGPIFKQMRLAIDQNDTTATLTEKLTTLAIPALVQVISDWTEKKIVPQAQDDAQATVCNILTRDDGEIDWEKTNTEIYNLYRGLMPWPGIWTTWNGKRLKLLSITPSPIRGGMMGGVFTQNNHLYVATADASIEITELQLEGRKPMSAKVFCNGYKKFSGSVLPS